MNKVYKLNRQEFMQAIADYLTKKYAIKDRQEMDMGLQIDGKTGGLIIDITPSKGDSK